MSRLVNKNWQRPLILEPLERRDLLSFFAPLLVPTGDEPRSIAMADFNSDGNVDIVTANDKMYSPADTISILLGQGGGVFQSATNYPVGGDPQSVGVADMNGDGRLDVVATLYQHGEVSINLGNGDGTFQTVVKIGAGFHSAGLALDDFDADGDIDLAVTNDAFNGGLVVLLNNGDGTFHFTGYAVSSSPIAVAAADFNSDGIPDLAVGGALQIMIGNGDGSFQPPTWIGNGFGSLVVTELHGDGHFDIVLTNNNSDTIDVLRGNGDGTFLPPKTYPAGTKPNSITGADMDGDGDVDIIVGNTASTITVLRNQLGSLRRRVSYSVGDIPVAVAVADVNGDGLPDVATSNRASDSATILLGTGGGALSALPIYSMPTGGDANGITAHDVDVDGILDLTVLYSVDIILSSLWTSHILTFNGLGNGAFSAGTSIQSEGGGDVIVHDLNNDGFQDYAVGRYYATIHLGGPSGYFQAPLYNAGPKPDDVALGDFNQDGILDMVVPNNVGGAANVSILLGNGDGSFRPPSTVAVVTTPSAVAVADLNGDGFLDVAAAGSTASVLLGNGDGSFEPAVGYNSGGTGVGIVADDYNGDGKLDLGLATSNGIRVLLNLGAGTFGMSINTSIYQPLALAGGDFNSDGKADLVANGGTYPNYGLHLFLGNGNGTFSAATLVAVGAPRPDVDVADVNNDGFQDIVSIACPLLCVRLGNGDGTFVAAPDVYAEPASLAIDDLNEDGILDLVTVLESITAVRFGNGDGTFGIPSRYVLGSAISSVAVADFNGDLFRDIVGVGNIGAHVLLNEQDGSFPGPAVYEGGLTAGGDFNSDGLFDLASSSPQTNPPTVEVLLASGGGGVYPSVQGYAVGKLPLYVAVTDVSNDGILDIVSANYDGGTISVLLGNGDGTFQSSTAFPAGTKPEFLATGDFNADGNTDVTVTNDVSPGTVRLLLGNGDGTFQVPIVITTGTGTVAGIVTADFNGDGKFDFAVVAPSAVSIILGNGDATFKAPLVYAVLAKGLDLTVGDFNGDGFVDIAAVNEISMAILFNAADWPPLPISDGPGADVRMLAASAFTKPDKSTTHTVESNPRIHRLATVDDTAKPGAHAHRIRPAVRYAIAAGHDPLGDVLSIEMT